MIVAMLSVSLFAVAQTPATDKKTTRAEKKEAKAAAKGKAISLTGWVKSEGDKVTFVTTRTSKPGTCKTPTSLSLTMEST
jgi:hypothetical protein